MDGRPYHLTGFAAEIEAYHERAANTAASAACRSRPRCRPQPELSIVPAKPNEHRSDPAPEV